MGLGLGLGLGVRFRLLEMGAHLDVVGLVAGQREDAALVGVNVGLGFGLGSAFVRQADQLLSPQRLTIESEYPITQPQAAVRLRRAAGHKLAHLRRRWSVVESR